MHGRKVYQILRLGTVFGVLSGSCLVHGEESSPPAAPEAAPASAIPPPRPYRRTAQAISPRDRAPAPAPLEGQPQGNAGESASAAPRGTPTEPLLPQAPSFIGANFVPIDLNTTLRLAGVQNPDVLVAQSRVVEAQALRQLAAAQFLPTINYGMNYDTHTGVLQQSNGNILSVNRSAVYVGAGTNAVAAGTVNIPGVFLQGNVAVAVFGFLASRQVVVQRDFANWAIRNQAFLSATLAYSELLRAEGLRAVAMQVRDEAREVARLTAAYSDQGRGSKADADRAATQLARRENEFQAAEGQVLVASARLAEVINVDPSIRLHPTDAWVVPHPLVPDPIPVAELIALALLQRPELGERRAAIQEALLVLDGAKLLPFSPSYLVGFSAGGFGGGSNLVRPVFGGFGGRTDFDAVFYWTAQNMGVGNLALINVARSRVGIAQYQQVAVLDRIRAEVAEAYARTHARYAQIGTSERAVRSGTNGFREDLDRIRGGVGLPIEVLDNLNLLARARLEYLNSIVDYNEAQFQLFVALGQPPADALAHPVPTAGVVPRGQPIPTPANPSSPLNPGPENPANRAAGGGGRSDPTLRRVATGSSVNPPNVNAGTTPTAQPHAGR
jgi:outer membrane protein TolC